MKLFRGLYEQFKAYHAHGRPIVQYTGMVGIAAYPLFYLLRFTKADAPYNDLWLRIVATLICVGLASRGHWPKWLQPYYTAYSYGALLYCLPFFFIFTSLTNGGGVVAVANTLMAVFFLILLSDWRNSVFMLVTGAGLAAALFAAVVPDAVVPMDYVARLPILVLVVIGGSLFKFAEKQAEAEKLKRIYTALAGSIAHEMRNPLGQLRHSLQSMQQALPQPTATRQEQTLGAREVNELYRQLAQSELAVKRGLQIISMTLDEVSARPMDTASFAYLSAAEAVRKAVQEYGYDSAADRDKVSVEIQEDFSFRGDETAYLFVLFNLLKNALYYLALDPQARVTISVQRQQVRVRDTGPGIAAELLPQLFEPFRSVGKSGGTGLGLAYCQRVMRAFGGSITCASVPGEYTEFSMHFPEVGQAESEAYQAAVLARAAAAFKGKRLLVVDDDAALRMTTRHKLQPLGAVIDEASDGQRALDLLARQPYDLIVLDLNMPVLDGYAVATQIRRGEFPANRDVRIVAHTSEPAHVASVKAQKAGMDGFLTKPCARLPMIQALHHALESPPQRHDPEPAVLQGLNVLLADDNAYTRKAVAAYLKHAGASVTEAAHGQAVLDLLQAATPCDVVLMDLNMPGLGGLDTARAIRGAGAPWRDLPVIALTAHSDQGAVLAASAAGMDGFITKPVDAADLYQKLSQLERRAQSLVAPAPGPALLDLERLASYRRIGMLDELLADYLPEITRLAAELQACAARDDLQASRDVLHSLLGLSAEAGALALHQMARAAYEPMVEENRWPPAADWAAHVTALAHQSEAALKAYGIEQSPFAPTENAH